MKKLSIIGRSHMTSLLKAYDGAPNEVGFDIDLAKAVAEELGVCSAIWTIPPAAFRRPSQATGVQHTVRNFRRLNQRLDRGTRNLA